MLRKLSIFLLGLFALLLTAACHHPHLPHPPVPEPPGVHIEGDGPGHSEHAPGQMKH